MDEMSEDKFTKHTKVGVEITEKSVMNEHFIGFWLIAFHLIMKYMMMVNWSLL